MNGYSYSSGYNGSGMEQGDQSGGDEMMMMGQDGMASGMVGGQSLNDIVNQNAKASRRQSMPHQFGGSQTSMDPGMRRISMMDYSSSSPVRPMGNFQYDPNANMNQGNFVPGNATPGQNQQQQQRSHSRRQSQSELALNTTFPNPSQNYNPMMHPQSAYQSPAPPQSGFEMTMDSPYMDPGIGMQMDYKVDQNLGGATAAEMPQMNLYSQPQFNQSMTGSPMNAGGSQGLPHSAQGPSQDPGGGGGMGTQYSGHTNSSQSTVRNPSRSHSLHIPSMSSPVHSGGATPMSQPASAEPQNHSNTGFQGQPQNPPAGSRQDRGIGNSSQVYDGVNGPVPVNTVNYNPNTRNFPWEASEGGWPSTMVGRPHTQTSYKNAYSSTGFDMLGVLVRCLGP